MMESGIYNDELMAVGLGYKIRLRRMIGGEP